MRGPAPGDVRRRTCWSASTTATTRPSSGSTSGPRVVSTADFFTPVVDDAYDWGRIAAANALSDVYAMGGRPLVAVNLRRLAARRAARASCSAEVLRGGLDVARAGRLPRRRRPQHRRPGAQVRHGGHRRRRPGPAAAQRRRARRAADQPDQAARRRACSTTGTRRPARCSRRRSRRWSRSTRRAAQAALAAGVRGGHRRHRVRPARAPVQAGPRLRGDAPWSTRPRCPTSTARGRRCATATSAAAPGATSTGCARTSTRGVDEDELLLLADAQTSGGLLVVGEVPGAPVIGELVPRGEKLITIS